MYDLTAQCFLGQTIDHQKLESAYRKHDVETVSTLKKEAIYFEDGYPDLYIPFASGLWAGGFVEGTNDVRLAASTGYISFRDYTPGPWFMDTSLKSEVCVAYNRVWKITNGEIRRLNENFADGTLALETIPLNILEWPAKGNIHFDEPILIERDLAPFFDYNNDEIYNPLDGDYPIVLEENPDFIPFEFMFTVYNDNKAQHFQSSGDPVHMEIHQMDYLINCEDEIEANLSVFTRLKLIYHGDENLINFNASIFDENVIGCVDTDHIGCNTEDDVSYVYNRDGLELEKCFSGADPGVDQTIYSTVALNHELESFISLNLNAGGPLFSSYPSSDLQHYNYTNAQWRDGTPLTYGGDGYDTLSTDFTSHIFPDLPTDSNGWSMQNNEYSYANLSTVSTMWKGDLESGDEIILDFCDFVYIDRSAEGLEIFNDYEEAIANLKQQFQSFKDGSFICNEISAISNPIKKEVSIKVYPNPVHDELVVELDLNAEYQEISLFDLLGKELLHKRITDTTFSIHLGNINAGVYFLRFRDTKNEVFVKKIQIMD